MVGRFPFTWCASQRTDECDVTCVCHSVCVPLARRLCVCTAGPAGSLCVVLPTLVVESLRRMCDTVGTTAVEALHRVRSALEVTEVVSAGALGVSVENPVLLSVALSLKLSAFLNSVAPGLGVLLDVIGLSGTLRHANLARLPAEGACLSV